MIDHIRDIKEGIEEVIASNLGPTYKSVAYVNDVEKNSYKMNANTYGVRALAGSEVPGVTKNVHVTQTFEMVFLKAYRESSLDDSEQMEQTLDNQGNVLGIYKDLINTKANRPLLVLNVTSLQISEPEFITESKVAIQRASVSITYRFSLI